MANDEEKEAIRELLGDAFNDKELNDFLETTIAGNPVGVKLSLLRYCRRSTAVPFVFGLIIFFLLLTWGLSLWTWWAAFLPALLTFVFFLALLRVLQTAKRQYREGLLIPAIVTSLSPLQVVALANMSKGEHSEEDPYETHFGLKLVSVSSLDPHPRALGTVIPCAAVFHEGADDDCWTNVVPDPVCWGTGDKSVLNECLSRLDAEDLENLRSLIANKTIPTDPNALAILVKDILAKPSGPPPMPT